MNEFDLITYLTAGFPVYHKNVVKGIGDDAAVWTEGSSSVLFTTDTMVEGDHFIKQWFEPEEIGQRLIETNVSDIAAMGGLPRFLFLSLVIDDDTNPDWLKRLYAGIKKTVKRYKISLLGGNITHGKTLSVTVGIHGYSSGPILYRNGAKTGDLLVVTGTIGDACIARLLLKKGTIPPPSLRKRLALPTARVGEAQIIKWYASAMIDISDGIASEARHLGKESKRGVIVDTTKLPISKVAKKHYQTLNISAIDGAMRGGEDYELMFTISKKNYVKLLKKYKPKTPLTIIGEITFKKDYQYLFDGKLFELPSGFDHFKANINL